MNYRTLLVAISLMTSLCMPAQARTRSMARTLTSIKQGLKFYINHPVIWGQHKQFTPSTLTAALLTSAITAYIVTQYYEQDKFDITEKTDHQQAITNACIWIATAGLGAANGAIIGKATQHPTATWALYGALVSVGALLSAELYKKCRTDLYDTDQTATKDVDKLELPKSLHSCHAHTIGDLCTYLTLLSITAGAGIGANWLLDESPDVKRSAIAGVIGGIVGNKVYKYLNR